MAGTFVDTMTVDYTSKGSTYGIANEVVKFIVVGHGHFEETYVGDTINLQLTQTDVYETDKTGGKRIVYDGQLTVGQDYQFPVTCDYMDHD